MRTANDPTTDQRGWIGQAATELGDTERIVADARLRVCEALVANGYTGAIQALASASFYLAPYVVNDDLLPAAAWDPLQEVAENLGLVAVFGQDATQEAIAFGMRICIATRHHAETVNGLAGAE
jgi:hypothetical protein